MRSLGRWLSRATWASPAWQPKVLECQWGITLMSGWGSTASDRDQQMGRGNLAKKLIVEVKVSGMQSGKQKA